MGSVADFVEDTVSDVVDTVGDVVDSTVEMAADAVEDVGNTVEGVVEGALEDPIGTMATVAAIAMAPATGGASLAYLPAISAARVVANGGDLEDAAKAAAITYASQGVGEYVGGEFSAAGNYGTDVGSQQTAMLAAQDAGMGASTIGGKLAGTVAGAGTGAALSGRDVDQSIMGALAGFGMNLGMNTAGQIINSAGDVIADSYDEFMADMNQTADQPGDYPLNAEELAAADTELGGLPSINEGDQPGDYDTTPEELAASEQALADMDTPDTTVYGDQPGDFPTTAEDLALEDELMGQVGDQPGDYDTTPEELAASEQALSEIPDAPVDTTGLDTSAVGDYVKSNFTKNFLNRLLGGAATVGAASGITGNTTGGLTALNGSNNAGNETPFGAKVVTGDQIEAFSLLPKENTQNQDATEEYKNPFEVDFFKQNPYFEADEYAEGGSIPGHNPEFFSEGGIQNRYVKGEGDGTSDSVPAMLASGEFVIPADVVSNLGNGDNDAGAEVLDEFLKAIRVHKRSAKPNQLPEDSKGPLAYLQEAHKKARK